MARMIPRSIHRLGFTTAGERKVFDILKKTLPETCIARYEVFLGERAHRPDFMIIDPSYGVLIIEVKDWGVSSITRATSEQCFIIGMGRSKLPKPQLNPNRKCEVYQLKTREQLVAMPSLHDESYLLLPSVDYFVAFPNIAREEFLAQELDKVIPVEHVLFREDLSDTGAPFKKHYQHFSASSTVSLSSRQIDDITAALFPDLTIPRITNEGFIPTQQKVVVSNAKTLQMPGLSLEQEEIAKGLGEGPRLLRGIAGTGKTLIMLYRAKLTVANDPDQRILVLCWNTALANYMRQAYAKFQFEAQGGVEIVHFTQFARHLLGWYCDPDYDWDDPRIMDALNRVSVHQSDQYDAVYIDEAQDFRKEWIEFIFNRMIKGKPEERNLIIAADDAQCIYRHRAFTWRSLGIEMIGRSKVLRTIYRNSARVWVFSAFLLAEKASYVNESEDKLRFAEKGGYDPQLIECPNLDKQIDKAIEIIQKLLSSGHAARNVLILYRHGSLNGYHLVDTLSDRLSHAGIPFDWIAQDSRAKRSFNWDTDAVKISTIHSAKGMDSPVVIVLGAETFRFEYADHEYDETRMMYVALTRAREFLVVLYSGDNGLVPELQRCYREYKERRDKIIGLEQSTV